MKEARDVGAAERVRALEEALELLRQGMWLTESGLRLAVWALEGAAEAARAEAAGGWSSYVRAVMGAVCAELEVTEEALRSGRRELRLVWGRNMVMALLRESRWQPSLAQVGAVVGRKHCTVKHGLASVEKDAAHVPAFRTVWARVRARVAAWEREHLKTEPINNHKNQNL